jgi:hypothetical protein
MIKKIFICTFLLLLIFSNVKNTVAKTKHEVLGIKIGMNRDDARRRLEKLGKLEKEESKQQEVWMLTDEPHYSYIIIGFNKEKTKVRFITAKARENGRRVRYADVLDIKKAEQNGATNNYKYQLKVPAHNKTPGYIVTARGTDAGYLTYFSIKQLENDEGEID